MYGKRFKRRSFGRKANRSGTIQKFRTYIYPDKLAIKLKYNQSGNFSGTTSGLLLMRGNSIYDPYAPTGGGQPPLTNSLFGVYGNVCVIGSKMTCTFVNQGTQTVRCAIMPSINTNSPVGFKAESEARTRFGYIGPADGGSNKITLRKYFTTGRIYGTPNPLDIQTMSHLSTGNPTDQWYWKAWCTDQSTSTVALNVDVYCTMTYYCIFRQKISLVGVENEAATDPDPDT